MSEHASKKRKTGSVARHKSHSVVNSPKGAIPRSWGFEDGETTEDSTSERRKVVKRSIESMRNQIPTPRIPKFPSPSKTYHLCQSCVTIDFDKVKPGPSVWKATALNLGTLSQFTVDADCLLCQLFASMASLAYTSNTSDSRALDDITFYLCAFHTSAMYSHAWRNSRTLRGLEPSVSFAVIDEHVLHDKEDSFTKERKMSNTLWSSRTSIQRSGWLTPVCGKAEVEKRFAATILKSEADLSLVGRWIDFCLNHHHESCGQADARPVLALQMVDCHSGFIVSAKLECKYLAMSYVWGTAPVKDLEENQSLLDENTPILIQDAISVTKNLGYRYLWIDRYCIPQVEGKERHSQLQQMDLIYSSAQATIIAVASSDPSEGLHGMGNRARAASVTFSIGNLPHTYVPPYAVAEITASTWASRGWTHQETILSRRRIFFCKNQIYFECAGMRCQDTMSAPLDLLHDTKELRMFSKWNRPGLFSRVRRTADPLGAILDHISVYTCRHLTRPDDILNGIMGTFHAFETIYDSFRHYWGIPMVPDITYKWYSDKDVRISTRTEQFLTGLCWRLSGARKRRAGFPSWSWAGWYGIVDPHRDEDGYVENKYNVKIWIGSIFKSQMDLGTFCDTTVTEVFPNNPKPCVFIKADFFYVRFRLAMRSLDAVEAQTKWEAVINAKDGQVVSVPFHITRHTSAGDGFYERMAIKNLWSSFILGDRLKTKSHIHSGSRRKVLSNESPDMIIIVVEELEKDIIERVGIIEINDPEDRAKIEGITKHRRARRYG